MRWRSGLPLLLLPCLCSAAMRYVRVVERTDVLAGASTGSAGPYERIIAKAHFLADPADPANQIIQDIALAPRNEKGLVEFSADLYVLKPRDSAKGNGTVLLEIPNRGGKGMLPMFNLAKGSLDPRTAEELGDQYLLRQGYTLVWVGWQWDVPQRPGLVRLYPPTATQNGQPIRGLVRAEMLADKRTKSLPLADRGHQAYPVTDPDDPAVQLTVRDKPGASRRQLPRSAWQLAREENGQLVPDPGSVYMAAGFQPGKLYELVYRSENPRVTGTGLLAVRDTISFLKYGSGDTLLNDQRRYIKRAIGFGTSQSGRFLRKFLYDGCNADEKGRMVFDGVWAHVAGAGRGSFNHRFAQASRDGQPLVNQNYPTDVFPFTDDPETDPVTGKSGGLLQKAMAAKVTPKIFYTNGAYEYWGRSASLLHTSVDGKQDLPLGKDSRLYMLAGTQHMPVGTLANEADAAYGTNLSDYRWVLRGLLDRMQAWLANGQEPPPSRYPRIDKDELVTTKALSFPKLQGVPVPATPYQPARVEYGPDFETKGIIMQEPPQVGKPYTVLVPQADADGNDKAGIRLPEIAVPLGTYTGWNLRSAAIGSPEILFAMVGSYFPFAPTQQERQRTGDPRPSVAERYASQDEYLAKVRAAAEELATAGYVRAADVPQLVERGKQLWRGQSKGK